MNLVYVSGCLAYLFVCELPGAGEGQRGHQISQGWSYRWLRATMWALGIKLGPLEEQSVLLTAEQSLHP